MRYVKMLFSIMKDDCFLDMELYVTLTLALTIKRTYCLLVVVVTRVVAVPIGRLLRLLVHLRLVAIHHGIVAA